MNVQLPGAGLVTRLFGMINKRTLRLVDDIYDLAASACPDIRNCAGWSLAMIDDTPVHSLQAVRDAIACADRVRLCFRRPCSACGALFAERPQQTVVYGR
eukprot:gene14450-13060_t